MLARLEKRKVPILMYHSISHSNNRKFKQFTVAPSLFAEQMLYLYQQSYTPITVTQFMNTLSQENAVLPEKPVILTFDDGFADFFVEALPILKRYNFAATLYIATAFVNGSSCWLSREGESTRPMVTWEQLIELSRYGIECGAHSHHHYQLDMLPCSVAQDEIVQSKRLLEQHLGQEIVSFAYPYGYYTATARKQIREAGFTSACAVKHRFSSAKSDPFALARLMVKPDTNIEALAALLDERKFSDVSAIYTSTRTYVWQIVRRSSALLQRYFKRGLLTQ